MLSVNPFAILAETVSPIFMQSFVLLMIVLIAVGTLVDIIHKKNVKYFFENAKKARVIGIYHKLFIFGTIVNF